MLLESLDRTAQPREVELAFRRLHEHPSKFRDANVGEADFGDLAGVFFPEGFRCLIGIVVNAEQERD